MIATYCAIGALERFALGLIIASGHVATLATYKTIALRWSVVLNRLNNTATASGDEVTGSLGSINILQ